MATYNPQIQPNPSDWLALDEQERILLVEAHHKAARIKLPNLTVHAAVHAIVENQIAEGFEPVVRAIARLTKEGLSRHDAVHAIGSVLAEHFFAATQSKNEELANTTQARYNAAIERLTAKSWRQQYGS